MATKSSGIVSGWSSFLKSKPRTPSAPSTPSSGGGGGSRTTTSGSDLAGTTATPTNDGTGRVIYTDRDGKIVATKLASGKVVTSTGQTATISDGALRTSGGTTTFTETGSATTSTLRSGDVITVTREAGVKTATQTTTPGRTYQYLSPAAEAEALKRDNMTPADANFTTLQGRETNAPMTSTDAWRRAPTGWQRSDTGDAFAINREPGASLSAAILTATGQPLRVTATGTTSVKDPQGAMFSTKNINPFLPGVNIGRLNTLQPGVTTTSVFRLERVKASKAGAGGVVPLRGAPVIETSITSRTDPVTLTGKAFGLLPEGDQRLLRYAGKGAGTVLDATSATLNYSAQNLGWAYDATIGRASGALGRALDFRGGLTLSAQDFSGEARRWALRGDESFTRGARNIVRGRVVSGVNQLSEGLIDYWSSTSFRAAAAWQRGLATDPLGLAARSTLAAATVQSPGLAADYLMFRAVDRGIAATWSDKDTRFARQFVGGVILAENPANVFGGRSFARAAPALADATGWRQFLGAGNAIARSGGVYEGLAQVYVYEQVNEQPFNARRYAQGAAFGYASSFVLGGLYGRSKLPGASPTAQSIGEKSELAAWVFDPPEAPGDFYTGLRGPSRFSTIIPVGSVTQNLDIAALGFSGETTAAASTSSTVVRMSTVSPETGMNARLSIAPIGPGVSRVSLSATTFLASPRQQSLTRPRGPTAMNAATVGFAPTFTPSSALIPSFAPPPPSTLQPSTSLAPSTPRSLAPVFSSAFAPAEVLSPVFSPVQTPAQIPSQIPSTVPTGFGVLPAMGFGESKRRGAKREPRLTSYTPSLRAAAEGIRAPPGFRPKKTFTGFELRPLASFRRAPPQRRRRRNR